MAERSVIATGRYLRFRDAREDGRNGQLCKLHLRVVCGVCPHFEGRLRGPRALCVKLNLECDPAADARGCEYWSRKGAGV